MCLLNSAALGAEEINVPVQSIQIMCSSAVYQISWWRIRLFFCLLRRATHTHTSTTEAVRLSLGCVNWHHKKQAYLRSHVFVRLLLWKWIFCGNRLITVKKRQNKGKQPITWKTKLLREKHIFSLENPQLALAQCQIQITRLIPRRVINLQVTQSIHTTRHTTVISVLFPIVIERNSMFDMMQGIEEYKARFMA